MSVSLVVRSATILATGTSESDIGDTACEVFEVLVVKDIVAEE